MNCETLPEEIVTTILHCAQGRYPRSLLAGTARWSGADLAGNAKRYGFRYAGSRTNLIRRINAALPEVWEFRTEIHPETHKREAAVYCDGALVDWW